MRVRWNQRAACPTQTLIRTMSRANPSLSSKSGIEYDVPGIPPTPAVTGRRPDETFHVQQGPQKSGGHVHGLVRSYAPDAIT